MKTHPTVQTFGCLDMALRVAWLEAKGDPLSRLGAVIDWEGFRPRWVPALAKPAPGPGGRPANDPMKRFTLLVVQRYDNLSDAPTEHPVSDRLRFQQCAGWTVADPVPEANPLGDFREALVRAEGFEQRVEPCAQPLPAQGLLAQAGKRVDARFVDVPRPRNARAENAPIQAGGVPEAWVETPAKPAQKDVAARWTKKHAEGHYGYKNPVTADAQSRRLERDAVTEASGHDSQQRAEWVETVDGEVYADSADRRAEAEAMRAQQPVVSQLHERADRHRPLTAAQPASHRQQSRIRARIEPVFGLMRQSMKGFYRRSIGRRRNAAAIGLINLIYNRARYEPIVRLKLLPRNAV